jgi:hypothetical protein
MAKKTKAVKALDAVHFGTEPDLRGEVDRVDIMKAYNWYSYNCDADQAKNWIIEYLKEFHKSEKELIKHVTRANSNSIGNTVGWNCRILLLGGSLPEEIKERTDNRIRALARTDSVHGELRDTDSSAGTGTRGKASRKEAEGGTEEDNAEGKEVQVKRTVSIQERVINRANELIADLEVQIDNHYRDGSVFRPSDWLSRNDVKPAIAQRIADYYKPLYSEIFDAYQGKDPQLKEAYSSWKKTKLKLYLEFIKSIVSDAETRASAVKVRKARKKKEKTPAQLVSKLKYKETDETYSLQSARATDIPGCSQLWLFNTKYRTLAVYNAMGPTGIGIKGSTLTGFDEKTSVVKKLRKPTEQLNKLKDGGKIILRKLMSEIKCKEKPANGRINKDTILVRIVK